jgi:hypothetical protein
VAPGDAAGSVKQEFGTDQEANASARGDEAIKLGRQRTLGKETTTLSDIRVSYLRRFDIGRAVVDLKPDDT